MNKYIHKYGWFCYHILNRTINAADGRHSVINNRLEKTQEFDKFQSAQKTQAQFISVKCCSWKKFEWKPNKETQIDKANE